MKIKLFFILFTVCALISNTINVAKANNTVINIYNTTSNNTENVAPKKLADECSDDDEWCISGDGTNADDIEDDDDEENEAVEDNTKNENTNTDFNKMFKDLCMWQKNQFSDEDLVNVSSKNNECQIEYVQDTTTFAELQNNINETIKNFNGNDLTCEDAIYAGKGIWRSDCKSDSIVGTIVFDYSDTDITCDDGYEFKTEKGYCDQKDEQSEPSDPEPAQEPETENDNQNQQEDLSFLELEDSNMITISDFENERPKDATEALGMIEKSKKYEDKISSCAEESNYVICEKKKVSQNDKDKSYKFVFKSIGDDASAEEASETRIANNSEEHEDEGETPTLAKTQPVQPDNQKNNADITKLQKAAKAIADTYEKKKKAGFNKQA